MDMFEFSHKQLYDQLQALPDNVKALFRLCGGLHGLFKLSSSEAKASTLEQKRECVRQLVAAGITEHTVRMAFIHAMAMKGYSVPTAVSEYEEQMNRFSWSKETIETLRVMVPEAGI
jgi:hypothetical protein